MSPGEGGDIVVAGAVDDPLPVVETSKADLETVRATLLNGDVGQNGAVA
jgi:hypothetical protein